MSLISEEQPSDEKGIQVNIHVFTEDPADKRPRHSSTPTRLASDDAPSDKTIRVVMEDCLDKWMQEESRRNLCMGFRKLSWSKNRLGEDPSLRDLCAWDVAIRDTLGRHDLTKYIDEDIPDVEETHPDYRTWRADRAGIVGLLTKSLSVAVFIKMYRRLGNGYWELTTSWLSVPRQFYQRVFAFLETPADTLGSLWKAYTKSRIVDSVRKSCEKYLELIHFLRRRLIAHGMDINDTIHTWTVLNPIQKNISRLP
ncbi:hypothetical protein B0H63DRAFT_518172 [Podospora didyma]|uniref:Uncharacterized protein n=1 Tax=Podospora didyma TaxID=330526 RepID=A0AAE0P823_9PEZI|nr:hypothetical protein B0H63DRAFT_518172 [Podospora didyma]